MQVNSVNNQNSFGLKFSPKMRSLVTDSAEMFFANNTRSDKAKLIFEHRVRRLLNTFPNAELDIAPGLHRLDSRLLNGYDIILKRNAKSDIKLSFIEDRPASQLCSYFHEALPSIVQAAENMEKYFKNLQKSLNTPKVQEKLQKLNNIMDSAF